MNPLVSFLASRNGRIVRILAGLALIAFGLFTPNNTGGVVLIVIGLIPLLAGTFDFCLVAALFGLPLSGKQIRVGK